MLISDKYLHSWLSLNQIFKSQLFPQQLFLDYFFQDELSLVVQKIIAIATKKVPLRELCASVLLKLLEKLKGESEKVCELVLPYMALDCGWNGSSEAILLLITLQRYFKEVRVTLILCYTCTRYDFSLGGVAW